MNPIDWSFNLREFILAIVITVGSLVLALIALTVRRHMSLKTLKGTQVTKKVNKRMVNW